MKSLIPMNEYGLMADTKGLVRVDSRFIAERLGKDHNHVLRDIRALLNNIDDEQYRLSNFGQSSYINDQGRKQPCFLLTRNAFTLLVMGYNSKEAVDFKRAYIDCFNDMEHKLDALKGNRDMHPQLMEAIRMAHENPKPYDYSNELDMLNRIVIGMTAKQYRAAHGLAKKEPIRPHLTADELELMDKLQQFDCGFVLSIPDYHERKAKLEWCASQIRNAKIALQQSAS